MAIADTQIEKVVIVIHGVGDPNAGDTLNSFARSLAQTEKPLVEEQSTVWLGERSRKAHHTKTFPTHLRQLQINRRQVEMAEVFWGDLSQVRRGLVGLVYGIFQIVFGLRYVAYVAGDQPGAAAHYLKRLGLISSRILQGPVLAMSVFLAMITGAALCTDLIWDDSYKTFQWTQLLVAGCVAVGLFATVVGINITNSRVMVRFWTWMGVVSGYVLFLLLVKQYWVGSLPSTANGPSYAHLGLIWYCRVLIVFLGLLWFLESTVVIAMGGCWLASRFHARVFRPAIDLAFLLPALTVGVWGQALPMAWVFTKEGIGQLQRLPEFSRAFDEAVPLLGVQFVMVVIMLATTCGVMLNYFRWRMSNNVDNYQKGRRSPRLIVNRIQQWMLLACTGVGISLVFTLSLFNLLSIRYQDTIVGQWLLEANKYAIVVLVPLGGLAVVALPYLRPGFDILLDAINHFYFRPVKIDDALDDDDEFDIRETTFSSGSLFFSRRDEVHSRMKKILVYYRERLPVRPELVIICHSQGTMVATEVLNDPEMAWLDTSFASTTLVTMGSPLTHLYQHYFGHLYPSLNAPFWDGLRQRVDRWVNIFRIDDFVGQAIDFPLDGQAVQAATSVFSKSSAPGNRRFPVCSNHPLGNRGHVNYWEDSQALSVIRDQVFFADQSEEPQVKLHAA